MKTNARTRLAYSNGCLIRRVKGMPTDYQSFPLRASVSLSKTNVQVDQRQGGNGLKRCTARLEGVDEAPPG